MNGQAVAYLIWALLALSLVGLSVVAFSGTRLAGRLVARPGALQRTVLANRYVRVLALVGWMWLGWHLFAR